MALLEMTKAGLGISNAPNFFVKDALASGELVEILSEYKQKPLDIYVLYPNRRHLPLKFAHLLNFSQASVCVRTVKYKKTGAD